MQKKYTQYVLYGVAALLVIAAVVILALSFKKPPAEDLILGQMQIVLPADATDIEETAADELKTYIMKMTGEELGVVTEGSDVPSGIYIGATDFAAANKVTYPETEFGEGWAIKAVGRNLVLTGGETRGVLYAVYHLLEDSLGVRWWNYWEEYVPSLTEARVSGDYDDSGSPALVYRDVHTGGAALRGEHLFCVRNLLNGDTANAPVSYGGEEYFGPPAHVHTFNRYISTDYYETHPEWFAYANGGRISYGQLCLTNEELISVFTQMVIDSIDSGYANADAQGKNRPRYFSVSANDFDYHCICDACYASQTESGLSGHLLKFVNRIAEGVAEVYPEVYIETLAYQDYVEPPLDDTKPADNVVIRLADSEMDVLHGLDHENNAAVLERIKQWEAICPEGQLYIWDYVVTYGNSGVAPTMYKYADNFRTMAEIGIDGYFGEMENPIVTDFWDMKAWMIAKLSEDPYLDEGTLIDDFVNGYYGEAGVYVRQYLDMVNEKASGYGGFWLFSATTISPGWLKVEDIIAADEYFNQAFEAAAGDETLLIRLRQARCALDRVIVYNYDSYCEQAEEAGIDFDIDAKETCQRVVDCLTEQIAMRGGYDYDATNVLDIYARKLASMS